jgi:hypothetical protein
LQRYVLPLPSALVMEAVSQKAVIFRVNILFRKDVNTVLAK